MDDFAQRLRAAWLEDPHPALARALPAEPPFSTLFTGSLADVEARLRALEGKRDPQLSNALEQVLRDPPWTSNGARPVFQRVFDLVRASRDPRFSTLAREVRWTMRAPQEAWMRAGLAAAVAGLPEERPLTPAQTELLANVPSAPAAPRRAPDFAAVYAAPADDAPRHVLADALLEAGDPRGELLALQLMASPTAADRKREKALLAAHAKAWLAPFGRTLGADVVFRRGFPAEGLVKLRDQGDADRYGALPEWATFERLSWSPPKTGQHLRAAGFVGPAFRHLEVAEGLYVPWLLESDVAFALRAVSGRVESPATLRRLVETPHLPRLRTVHVTDDEVGVDWIEALFDAGRLEELGVRSAYPPRLLPLLAAAERTSLRRFSLGTALRFHRADDGTLSVLELLDPQGTYLVAAQLATLPDGAFTLHATPTRPADWPGLDRVLRGRGPKTSVADQAALDLDLNGPAQIRPCDEGLLVSDGSSVRLVDRGRGAVLRSYREQGHVKLAGDGWFVRDEGRVVAVDRRTAVRRTVCEAKKLGDFAPSGDGARLAVAVGTKVLVLDVVTGETVFETRGAEPALDETGHRLCVGVDADSRVIDLASGASEPLEGRWTASFFAGGGHAVVRRGQLRVSGPGAFRRELALLDGGTILRRGSRFVHLSHGPATIFDADGTILATLPGVSGVALEGDVLWMVRGEAVRTLGSMRLP